MVNNKIPNFHKRLYELMIMRNVTQRMVSLATGLSCASISAFVKGHKYPSARSLGKLAIYFNVSPYDFKSPRCFVQKEDQHDSVIIEDFGKKLKTLLKERNMTQKDFAEQIGLSRQSVNYYICGRSLPKPDVIDNICAFFDIGKDYFIPDASEYETEPVVFLVEKMPSNKFCCPFAKMNGDTYSCALGNECLLEGGKCPYLKRGTVYAEEIQ